MIGLVSYGDILNYLHLYCREFRIVQHGEPHYSEVLRLVFYVLCFVCRCVLYIHDTDSSTQNCSLINVTKPSLCVTETVLLLFH